MTKKFGVMYKMNYQDLLKAKEYFESIATICDKIDKGNWWEKPDGCEITLREIFALDIANFIMYLSASDGRLSAEEVQAYRTITGFGGDNVETIKQHIKENNIYSMDFESEPPMIMKLLSKAERNAILCGANFESSILQMMASFYGVIGQIIISIDGGITYNEKRDLNIIMDTIKGFAADHDILGNSWALLND